MRRALDIGVKVVLSHNFQVMEEDYEERLSFCDFLQMMRTSTGNGWELYADTASFLDSGCAGSIAILKEEISRGSIGPEALIYGSGFPNSHSRRKISGPANHLDFIYDLFVREGLYQTGAVLLKNQ